ncbi:hypothetical protein HYR82_03560 [Candidatus Peregrinibacteria bacterium]|nr:hypothetical protein [Candidatus Peregrinibacteria bacterium]
MRIFEIHTLHRRFRVIPFLTFLLTAGMATAAQADLFTIPSSSPQSFQEIQQVVTQAIPAYLTRAQCGGWNDTESVKGAIATVTGAPGKKGDPLGNVQSGMARRIEDGGTKDDGFQFPDTVIGKTTACKPDTPEVTVHVWCEGKKPTDRSCTKKEPSPLFKDPYACLYPGPKQPPLTEKICQEFCDWLNTDEWQYTDCRNPVPDAFDNSDPPKPTHWTCGDDPDHPQKKWVCTGQWVKNPPAENPNCRPYPNDNVKECRGQECRCPGPGCLKAPNDNLYQSFFRKYAITTSRGGIEEVPNDALKKVSAEAACYGFYDEFDPKTRRTKPEKDERCILNVKDPFDPAKLVDTQKGKGAFTMNPPPPDPLPEPRNPNFNKDTDLWYQNLGSALSFLSLPVFDGNLSDAFLTPDTAELLSSTQGGPWKPLGRDGTLRAVDDTVSNGKKDLIETGTGGGRGGGRPFTRWWQQFQTDAHRLFTPATVHLRLPAAWAFSLEPLHPVAISLEQGALDPRMQAIDVQLQATDDLPGILSTYLQQTALLPMREEPVPVVVPLGEPSEFRAYAQRWMEWKANRFFLGKFVPPQADQLIATLLSYAVQIEEVRSLRADLPGILGGIATKQKDLLTTVAQWMLTNAQQYGVFLNVARVRMELQQQWQTIAQSYAQFADGANLPWCRNDRFTTPVYSLLDPWYPGRPDLGGGLPSCERNIQSLPMLCVPSADRDFVYDLSMLRASTGSLQIPVLKPLQVRLAIPTPGPAIQDIADPQAILLPDLPPVPDIRQAFLAFAPTASVGEAGATVSTPPLVDLPQMKAALAGAQTIIDGMRQRYDAFWKSLISDDDTKRLQCMGYGQQKCVHVEMDLLERFTRIVARPAVLLREDFEAYGIPRVPLPSRSDPGNVDKRKDATCWSEDHACSDLPPERALGKDGWQTTLQRDGNARAIIDGLRRGGRRYTVQDDGTAANPPLPSTAPLPKILPHFDVPDPTDLSPPR